METLFGLKILSPFFSSKLQPRANDVAANITPASNHVPVVRFYLYDGAQKDRILMRGLQVPSDLFITVKMTPGEVIAQLAGNSRLPPSASGNADKVAGLERILAVRAQTSVSN